jgi:hypothetical protein
VCVPIVLQGFIDEQRSLGTSALVDLLKTNKTLRAVRGVGGDRVEAMMKVFVTGGTLRFSLDLCLTRSQWASVTDWLVDTTLAMSSLDLPAYVLLWIFDWIELKIDRCWTRIAICNHKEINKIERIVSVIESIRKVYIARRRIAATTISAQIAE